MIETCNDCMEESNISCEAWQDRCIIYVAQAIAGISKIPIEDCSLRQDNQKEVKLDLTRI